MRATGSEPYIYVSFACKDMRNIFVNALNMMIFPVLQNVGLTQSKSIFKPELRGAGQNYDGLDILMKNGFTYLTIPSPKYFHSIICCNDFHHSYQTRTLIYDQVPTFKHSIQIQTSIERDWGKPPQCLKFELKDDLSHAFPSLMYVWREGVLSNVGTLGFKICRERGSVQCWWR